MKLATIIQADIEELIDHVKYTGRADNSIVVYKEDYGKGKGKPIQYKLSTTVLNDPKKLGSFILDLFCYKEISQLFDYDESQINAIIESCKTRTNKSKILLTIVNNLKLVQQTEIIVKKELIIKRGFDSDVTDISMHVYFKNLFGDMKLDWKSKLDEKDLFFKNGDFYGNGYEGEVLRDNISSFIYSDYVWLWLRTRNYTINDITITSKTIESKFENETPGYVGKFSGDLKHEELLTLIIDDNYNPKLKFQSENTTYIDTNGFW